MATKRTRSDDLNRPHDNINYNDSRHSAMMIKTSYICSACRRRLFIRLRGHPLQWHTKALFTSSRNLRDPGDSLLDIADSHEDGPIKIPSRSTALPQRPKHAGDVLEAIFESALEDDPVHSTKSTNSVINVKVYRHVEGVGKMLNDKSIPRGQVWNHFVLRFAQKAIYDKPIARPLAFPYLARNVFAEIRKAIREGWKEDRIQPLPSMTEVVRVYLEQGLIKTRDWTQVIREMLLDLTSGEEYSERSRKALEADLLGVWKLFCLRFKTTRIERIPDPDVMDWSCLPNITSKRKDLFSREPGLRGLYFLSQTLLPNLPSQGPYQRSAACAAIISYGMLRHKSSVVTTGRSFLRAVGMIIGQSWRTQRQIREAVMQYLGIPDTDQTGVISKIFLDDDSDDQLQISELQPEFSDHMLVELIDRAVKAREMQRLDSLYASAIAGLGGEIFSGDKSSSLGLHNKFIKAYMSVRYPARAIEVWNHLIESGLTPTLQTWSAMIDGCRVAQDVQALESVWTKFQNSGMQPDVVLWTSVICGFIDNGGAGLKNTQRINAEKGIGLLQEMGRIWLEAEEKAVASNSENTAAKPTIHTLNAVMAALFRRKHYDIAPRILPWGKQFGIQPDLITYNTILRNHIRQGRTDKALRLLQRMEDSGIGSDEATFTITMDETFRQSSHFTQEQRTEVVNGVFDIMNKAGVRPNYLTYGKVIYILLQDAHYTGDSSTVQNVLDRMNTEGLDPYQSVYILTSLLDYYFALSPPDWDAITLTIEEMHKLSVSDEHIFTDRVIEGYAAAGHANAALAYFERSDRVGNRVGWRALCALMHALMENGEYESVKQLLSTVRSTREAPLPSTEHGKFHQHTFWQMVAEYEA